MLKPTERPPPSLAPRFAPSITPGPPPVITAQPCSPNTRPTARASSYGTLPSATRAEPNRHTAGRSISATCSNPARNSAAIFATDSSISASLGCSRIRRSSICLETVLRDVRHDHPDHERQRGRAVDRVGEQRLPASPAEPEQPGRPPHSAAVEDPERQQVDEVEEEADVGERLQEVRPVGKADEQHREARGAAEQGARDRDPRRLPGVSAGVLHVRAEERDEYGQLGI